MYNIKLTDEFGHWLNGLKDSVTRIRLSRRLEKASRGLLGDTKPIGEGVYEMREHFGPGWSMYYLEKEGSLIIMLAGGEKATQHKDIKKAKQLARQLGGA